MSSSFNIIKKRIKIRNIIGDDVEILDTSYGWKTLCFFHAESEPSFKVTESEDGDLWYCHGCKRGGDLFDFIEQHMLFNKRDAYTFLAEKAGLDEKDYEYPIDEFGDLIGKLQWNHSFFKGKKISKQILNMYGVGYLESIRGMGLKSAFVLKWGLGKIKDSIFYSIKDRSGLTKGYYIRPMSGGGAKYIGNSPLQIFGLHALGRGCPGVIMVEGFNDVLKLREEGIINVLGACGTNFNESMFRVLSDHGIRHIVFVPDGDAGGAEYIDIIEKKYGTFNTHGVSVGYALIDGDPDEFIIKNSKFFHEIEKHEINPIVTYYKSLYETVAWARISDIIYSKPFLPTYEVQLALKDEIGGVIDIQYAGYSFYDIKAEKMLISNMLKDSMIKSKMSMDLDIDYFIVPEHRKIFAFIKDNLSTTTETINNMFNMQFPESDIYGNEIYFNKIKELKKRRDVSQIINKYSGDIRSHNLSPDVLIQNIVNDFASMIKVGDDTVTVDNVVLSTIDNINSNVYDGISIADKFPQMNNIIRGLLEKKLVVIGGNSGHGKTSLACNMVDSICFRQEHKVVFFTGEMDSEELMLRFFSIYTGESYNNILDRKIKLEKSELKEMMHGRLIFTGLPAIEDLYGKVKMLFLRHSGIKVMFFDYVQLIKSREISNNKRYQELSYLTQTFKNLSKELSICIVAIAQLNKSNLNQEISKFDNVSGGYDMVADADLGMTIKKIYTQNSVVEGNAQINIDKVRYNQSNVLIPIYYNSKNLRMQELSVVK